MITIVNVTEESGNYEESGINNYNKETPIVGSFVEYKNLVALDNMAYTNDKSSRSSSKDDQYYYRERIKENKDDANDKVPITNDINKINKDKYSTLPVAIWNNNMKATTATLEKISLDKYFKANKANEKNKTKENKRLNKPYISSNTTMKRVTELADGVLQVHPGIFKATDTGKKVTLIHLQLM